MRPDSDGPFGAMVCSQSVERCAVLDLGKEVSWTKRGSAPTHPAPRS